MANSLKGNLGLKSSPLAPTSSKLTTQYIVLDHMTNHFKKISKAKSAIDNKPPKSLQTSQKMRDRRNRTRIMKSPLGTHNMTIPDDELQQQYEDILNDEPEDEEDKLVHSIMRSALTGKPRGSNNATYGSHSENTQTTDPKRHHTQPLYNGDNGYQARPSSARSCRSVQSAVSMTSRTPITHDLNRVTYRGDILQTRSHRFTEAGPFTPRTNKTNAESKLRKSTCYNPPRPKSAPKSQRFDEEDSRPRAPPRARKSSGDHMASASDHNFHDGLETGQLSESMLMDMSLRSRDDHSNRESDSHQIPRLNISMDKDHINWLQEQASKAKVRARSGAKLPVAEEAIPEESASLNQSSGLDRSIKMESLKKEEEQKYLAFAQEVTDDVLSRGISSERVIQRIFENHIERRKNDLDECRMRQVIKDLRTDLGLKDHTSEHGSVGGFSSTNQNNSNTSSRRPGSSGKSTDAGSVHQTESEKSFTKEGGFSASQTNGLTSSTTLEPLNYPTSHSEQDMSTTLESTSTMRFAGTKEMFSTINSEASQEAREAMLDQTAAEDELSTTQALKQYQMTLTAKEAGIEEVSESAMESTMVNSNGVETDVSEKSHKLERPATGELREGQEEDEKSDTSSFKASRNGSSRTDSQPRSRRRERMRKSRATEEFSSSNSQPASTETMESNYGHGSTSEDILSSSQRTFNGLSNGMGPLQTPGSDAALAQKDLTPSDVIDDSESVKSSNSARPVAKPRNSARSQPEPSQPEYTAPSAEERGTESGQNSARDVSDTKQDSSSHPTDSGIASGRPKPNHDDTLEEASEADHKGEDEDVDDDYEDDYDADEDDGQEVSTHRTSDDDF